MVYILVYRISDEVVYPVCKDDDTGMWVYIADERLSMIQDLLSNGYGKFYKKNHYSREVVEYLTFRPIILALPIPLKDLLEFMNRYRLSDVRTYEGLWSGVVGIKVDKSIMDYIAIVPDITMASKSMAN